MRITGVPAIGKKFPRCAEDLSANAGECASIATEERSTAAFISLLITS